MFDRLFDLAMPWWEFVLRAVVVYAVVLVMVRLSGKRTVGQFTPFDMILLIFLGTAIQNSLIGEDTSLLGGLILAATLLALNWLVGTLSARSRKVDALVEGVPVMLARDGEVFARALRRCNVSEADFEVARRKAGCDSDRDIRMAVLETSGEITIVAKER